MSALRFRLCTSADKDTIVAFMDANWGSEHALVHEEAFFDYYYRDGNRLQFAFAEQNGEVLALAGYILANKREQPDIWVSIWCAKKGHNGSGLELMSALPQLTGARVMACNNIRPKTIPFYTFLGYTGAELPHYYRLADKADYNIAVVKRKDIWDTGAPCGLVKITDAAVITRDWRVHEDVAPIKDAWYITRRYFYYPHQKYDVYARYVNDKIAALLATRTVNVNGTHVLRVADYIGEPTQFGLLGGDIDAMMQAVQAEYADMYVYGIPQTEMAKAGFTLRRENDENIIPNYLTPLLQQNTDYYFFTSSTDSFMMCKADGDQDRPNLEFTV